MIDPKELERIISEIVDDTYKTIDMYVVEWFDSSSSDMEKSLDEVKKEWLQKALEKFKAKN